MTFHILKIKVVIQLSQDRECLLGLNIRIYEKLSLNVFGLGVC